MAKETTKQKLARLQQELKELKALLPEHCSGTKDYVDVHRASTLHWQRIEEHEEEIKKLKAKAGR